MILGKTRRQFFVSTNFGDGVVIQRDLLYNSLPAAN